LGGNDGAGAGGKVGRPALDVAPAFPQATPASLFPPAGEMSPLYPSASCCYCRATSFCYFWFEFERSE